MTFDCIPLIITLSISLVALSSYNYYYYRSRSREDTLTFNNLFGKDSYYNQPIIDQI